MRATESSDKYICSSRIFQTRPIILTLKDSNTYESACSCSAALTVSVPSVPSHTEDLFSVFRLPSRCAFTNSFYKVPPPPSMHKTCQVKFNLCPAPKYTGGETTAAVRHETWDNTVWICDWMLLSRRDFMLRNVSRFTLCLQSRGIK